MAQIAWSMDPEDAIEGTGDAGANLLSTVVIGPDDRRRNSVAYALEGPLCAAPRQLPFYPELAQIAKLIEMNHDVVIVDLDSNPVYALEVVEALCASCVATVMVYSEASDSELMIRCMRAGAREFLSLPVTGATMAEAMVRASARRISVQSIKKTDGQLCMFWGAKGGSGVTTIATNFAIAAAVESGKKVLLIDLDLPLGDAVLNLGLVPQYSTVDALQNYLRLDANFLTKLLVQHESGLWVLAAPGKLVPVPFSTEAVDKLIQIARQEFDCVVVDSGSRFDLTGTVLFDPKANIYLISQVSIPELRNTNRLASEFFASKSPKFEIVLNRYEASSLGLDEDHIARIITRKPQWKVPNDFSAVRDMQNNASPIPIGQSGISRVIRQMARVALGLPDKPVKKKKLMNLF
ncbi:MAG TPA: AAA family ATPase [Terracidiphilus sp.]|jgi:pilus assembly protein CpaE|nr:AAA family ATPase [Terracidiphilus sp.]